MEREFAVACRKGDVQAFNDLLKRGFDIEYKNWIGFRKALHYGNAELLSEMFKNDKLKISNKVCYYALEYYNNSIFNAIIDNYKHFNEIEHTYLIKFAIRCEQNNDFKRLDVILKHYTLIRQDILFALRHNALYIAFKVFVKYELYNTNYISIDDKERIINYYSRYSNNTRFPNEVYANILLQFCNQTTNNVTIF